MISLVLVFSVCLYASSILPSEGALPSYVRPCKRNDPNLNQCVMKTFEELRSHLKKGIPELNVPAIDPLFLPEIVIAGSEIQNSRTPFKALATNVKVYGAGDYKIDKLNVDLKKMTFSMNVAFPFIKCEANYDVDAKILNIPIKGKGPLKANATNVRGQMTFQGTRVKINGKTHIQFNSMEIDLHLDNYSVRLFNLFNGDVNLNNAINVAINENKQEFIKTLKPVTEETVSRYILENLNKIFTRFSFEDFFPK